MWFLFTLTKGAKECPIMIIVYILYREGLVIINKIQLSWTGLFCVSSSFIVSTIHVCYIWILLFVLSPQLLFIRIHFFTHFDVIYQTWERVFHQDIQTPRSGLKKRGAAEFFWPTSRCFDTRWNTFKLEKFLEKFKAKVHKILC